MRGRVIWRPPLAPSIDTLLVEILMVLETNRTAAWGRHTRCKNWLSLRGRLQESMKRLRDRHISA